MKHMLLLSALFCFPEKQTKNFMFQTLSLSTTLPCLSLVKLCLLFLWCFYQHRQLFLTDPVKQHCFGGSLSTELDFLSVVSWLRDSHLVDTDFRDLQGHCWGLLFVRFGHYTGVSSLSLSSWLNRDRSQKEKYRGTVQCRRSNSPSLKIQRVSQIT